MLRKRQRCGDVGSLVSGYDDLNNSRSELEFEFDKGEAEWLYAAAHARPHGAEQGYKYNYVSKTEVVVAVVVVREE
jgi:hypothetical protein